MTTSAPTPSLGLATLVAVAVGVIVAQSTMVSLLQATAIGGWGFVGAMAIGFALMLCNSAPYAELALMMPRASGMSAYIQAGLGPLPAIFAVFAGYVVPALLGPAAELLLVDAVLGQLLPATLPALGWAALLLGVLVVLNLFGTDVFARVQTVLTFTMLVFLVLTGLAAWAAPAALPAAGGLTEWHGDSYWFPDYFADLDAILRALVPDGQVSLTGHSMGGNVACHYAGVRPARVARLIALDAFGLAESDPQQSPERFEKWLNELESGVRFRGYPDRLGLPSGPSPRGQSSPDGGEGSLPRRASGRAGWSGWHPPGRRSLPSTRQSHAVPACRGDGQLAAGNRTDPVD